MVKFIIDLDKDSELSSVIALKNSIDEALIEEIESVEVTQEKSDDESLGVGELLNSVSVVIKAAAKPLTELAQALRDYVKTFRTSITIVRPDGSKVTIDKGKNTSAEDIVKILKAAKD